ISILKAISNSWSGHLLGNSARICNHVPVNLIPGGKGGVQHECGITICNEIISKSIIVVLPVQVLRIVKAGLSKITRIVMQDIEIYSKITYGHKLKVSC